MVNSPLHFQHSFIQKEGTCLVAADNFKHLLHSIVSECTCLDAADAHSSGLHVLDLLLLLGPHVDGGHQLGHLALLHQRVDVQDGAVADLQGRGGAASGE